MLRIQTLIFLDQKSDFLFILFDLFFVFSVALIIFCKNEPLKA